MIELVVIDFDDTLSLTEESCFKIENHIAQNLGFPPMTREIHQKNWGKALKEAIIERIPGIDPDQFMEMHRQVFPDFLEKGKADVIGGKNIETLKKLKESGKHLAILTSRTLQEVEHLLDENHHINKYIEKIYHMDNNNFHKPDPRVFNMVLKNFSKQPENCVYIGDSVTDAIAAKGAGLHFIAVLESGLRTKKDFKEQPVDFFAKKFSDIIPYILEN